MAFIFGLVPTPVPLGVAGNWSLAFRDEFNGSSVDPSKWIRAGDAGGGGYSADPGFIFDYGNWVGDTANLSVAGGVLTEALTAASPTVHGSGLTTYSKVSIGYGYYEARLRFLGPGGWPAFWLYSPSTPWEIDILEGKAWIPSLGTIHANHWSYTPDLQETQDAVADPSSFLVVGVDVQPGVAPKFYHQGSLSWASTHDMGTPPADLALIINIASYPVGTTDSGSVEVDYVRYWTGAPT